MTFAAILQPDARSAERHGVDIDGTLRDAERQPLDVGVVDLSVDGFRATGPDGVPAGTAVSIGLPGLGTRRALVVRATPGAYGCRVLERLTPAELSTTMGAVVTAPIPFPIGHRADLLLETALPTVARYSPRGRVALIGGAVAVSWGLLLIAHILLA